MGTGKLVAMLDLVVVIGIRGDSILLDLTSLSGQDRLSLVHYTYLVKFHVEVLVDQTVHQIMLAVLRAIPLP